MTRFTRVIGVAEEKDWLKTGPQHASIWRYSKCAESVYWRATHGTSDEICVSSFGLANSRAEVRRKL
jgi:hypothetical protein